MVPTSEAGLGLDGSCTTTTPHHPQPHSELHPSDPSSGWQQRGARLPQVAEGSEVTAAGLQGPVSPGSLTTDTQQGREPRQELVPNLLFFWKR